jgi:hypothetical protein
LETRREAERPTLAREQERRERERQEAARRQRRRLIQEVKEVVVSESFGGWGGFPEKFRAQVLQEVERALSPLDLDELPRDELFIIARAARDKIGRAVEKAGKKKVMLSCKLNSAPAIAPIANRNRSGRVSSTRKGN